MIRPLSTKNSLPVEESEEKEGDQKVKIAPNKPGPKPPSPREGDTRKALLQQESRKGKRERLCRK